MALIRWGRLIQNRAGVVGPQISNPKTLASRKPVPIHPALTQALLEYRKVTPYGADENWIFASSKAKGKVPVWPSSLLADHIQPAVRRAGVQKHVSWHVFRRSYATLLKAEGADVKVVQQSLRHASSRINLDVYTQAVPEDVRTAQMRVVESLRLPTGTGSSGGTMRALL
jgi:integrase